MAYLIVLLVLGVGVYLISAPLRAARRPGEDREAVEVAELEAAREAKYQEIREAELDLRTGKLSDADYRAIDQTLRAEAVHILHRLDQARENDRIASTP